MADPNGNLTARNRERKETVGRIAQAISLISVSLRWPKSFQAPNPSFKGAGGVPTED